MGSRRRGGFFFIPQPRVRKKSCLHISVTTTTISKSCQNAWGAGRREWSSVLQFLIIEHFIHSFCFLLSHLCNWRCNKIVLYSLNQR